MMPPKLSDLQFQDADTLAPKLAEDEKSAVLAQQGIVQQTSTTTTTSNSSTTVNSQAAIAQANATVGLAQIELDRQRDAAIAERMAEHWVKTYWRPAMGWLYMLICAFDFIIAPVLTMTLPLAKSGYVPWQSLTLSNGGLFHLAMGAIIGLNSWGRSQEKILGGPPK